MWAFSSKVAQQALTLTDYRTMFDWDGPNPDRSYSFRLGPKPDNSDLRRLPDWECPQKEANDRDRECRFSFAGRNGDGPPEERYPLSWKRGTLAYKLERCLLEVDGKIGGHLAASRTSRGPGRYSAGQDRSSPQCARGALATLHQQG